MKLFPLFLVLLVTASGLPASAEPADERVASALLPGEHVTAALPTAAPPDEHLSTVLPAVPVLRGSVEITEPLAGIVEPDPDGFREAAHSYCRDKCHCLTIIDFIASIPDPDRRKRIWKRLLRDRFFACYPELYSSQLASMKDRDIHAIERIALLSGLPLR